MHRCLIDCHFGLPANARLRLREKRAGLQVNTVVLPSGHVKPGLRALGVSAVKSPERHRGAGSAEDEAGARAPMSRDWASLKARGGSVRGALRARDRRRLTMPRR